MSLKSNIIKAAAGLGLAALPFTQASAGDVHGRRRHAHQLLGHRLRLTTKADSSDSSSDFALNSARLYISGKATDNIGFMFNTEYNSGERDHPRHRRGGAVLVRRRQAQHLGGPIPAAQRSRQSLRAVLRQQLGRVPGRRAGRLSVRDRRPRRRRHVLGPVRQGQVLDRRVRRHRPDYRRLRRAAGVARAGGFLGQGRRLLPERHLLRREGPAGHRRRGADRGCR